nr:hypothetical protein MNFJLIIH_00014 [Escherichia coli]
MHELEVLLSRLKMEHLSYHVESLLEQAAKKELNYREFLCMALQQEWNGRHQRGMESRLKQARLPWVKTLEQFDFTFQPGIDRKVVRELAGLAFIDRNLNPQKTKKAPQNGCFFNTPCAPYERKRLLNRMTLIDTGYEWRFFAPFPVKWTQLPLCGSQPHTCCRASRSCIRTSSASR